MAAIATPTTGKRKFVADGGVSLMTLDEVLSRELADIGYSGFEVRTSPNRTEVIVRATDVQNLLGEKGRKIIRDLAPAVEKLNNRAIEKLNNNWAVCISKQAEPIACSHFGFQSDSEDSEDESTLGTSCHLMDKVGFVEAAVPELTKEYQLCVKEEVRNQVMVLERELMNENEKFTSALARVEKYVEARRDVERKIALQYQRRIAEELDNHLTAIRRDYERSSQLEERRIRDDAAFQEVKRKEKIIQEEKVRHEKVKAKAEMQARLEAENMRAEATKATALEADRRAAQEAVEKVATENSKKAAVRALIPPEAATGLLKGSDGAKKVQSAGNTLKGSESALKNEERRLQIYKDVFEQNEAFRSSYNQEYRSYERLIARHIRTVTGTTEKLRSSSDELIKILRSSPCPQSISIAIFANKVVEESKKGSGNLRRPYAFGRLIVVVTSQVPVAMEILLAQLNRACIYTVPKYISYSESAFETKQSYYKAIGFEEGEDGQLETVESYIGRISACMQLYGALVQTEVNGVQNAHGLEEGWAWIARFLNALPANQYTAAALLAFLESAGFGLHRRYRSQFNKLLSVISNGFLNAIQGDDVSAYRIRDYIKSKKFLEEPEELYQPDVLLSEICV